MLVDSGYGIPRWLLIPFKNPQNENVQLFNITHSKMRVWTIKIKVSHFGSHNKIINGKSSKNYCWHNISKRQEGFAFIEKPFENPAKENFNDTE